MQLSQLGFLIEHTISFYVVRSYEETDRSEQISLAARSIKVTLTGTIHIIMLMAPN